MIFPIGDTQVSGPYKPIVSYSLIGINVLVFVMQLLTPGNLICEYSVIPAHILAGDSWWTLISSMFLHGSYMHLIGNMVFLWIFGDNIEVKIGNWQFLVFYFFGGLISSWAHIYFNIPNGDLSNCCIPCQNINCGAEIVNACVGYVPSLGASGAISALMGAYLVMFPKSKIKLLVIIFFRSFYIPAILFLAFWFLQQLFFGMGEQFGTSSESQGVAWWAHIGGFVYGLLMGFYFRKHMINQNSNKSYV
ncbi:MAG TPA: rhomboid family intramembrane serine protease [Saprospiraceae bacterium]|nr:rhomboid family intramembrane serine protease [Saprospiraceae bacterium]MCB9329308.1 rhomboid family intramembrane serine protease [Lewinellaceae bacterium]HPK09933.1 rhomboid family intramembrane serine protease [Saprospiraceae bacterium]HPQ20815.1 rhomboid family intramembrane serine protease [Saprospiraceae bacterium]HRX30089.1 rhomboid family intramembrane serine protease [Saprospiraceae bacterium]